MTSRIPDIATADKVIDFIRKKKQVEAWEVATTTAHARNVLRYLKRRGVIKCRPSVKDERRKIWELR